MTVPFDEVSPEPAQGGGGGAFGNREQLHNASGRTVEMDNELLAWAQAIYTTHRNERKAIERQWYMNLAFFFGRQNVAVVQNETSLLGFSLQTPKAPPWRMRMVINHCRRVIRTEISKLASQRPRPFVVPGTTQDADIAAVRVG
jgi:hypothetical protein